MGATNWGAHLNWGHTGAKGQTYLINHIGLVGANVNMRSADTDYPLPETQPPPATAGLAQSSA